MFWWRHAIVQWGANRQMVGGYDRHLVNVRLLWMHFHFSWRGAYRMPDERLTAEVDQDALDERLNAWCEKNDQMPVMTVDKSRFEELKPILPRVA